MLKNAPQCSVESKSCCNISSTYKQRNMFIHFFSGELQTTKHVYPFLQWLN